LSELTAEVERQIVEYCHQTEESGSKALELSMGLVKRLGEKLEEAAKPVDLAPIMAQLNELLDGLLEIKAGLIVQSSNAELERDVLTRLKTKLGE
jgi:ABC-type transporter Mla subunit MlaD